MPKDRVVTVDRIKTISELSDAVRRFCDARDWDRFHGPKDLAIAISTEAAELLELFRFKSDSEISQMIQNDVDRKRVEDLDEKLGFPDFKSAYFATYGPEIFEAGKQSAYRGLQERRNAALPGGGSPLASSTPTFSNMHDAYEYAKRKLGITGPVG